ncbi:MAG: hypothetical protein IJC23_03465 [Bacteroidaceae bacterium]|nr:hypothetical protein [Bacteroidaceae bacterium]
MIKYVISIILCIIAWSTSKASNDSICISGTITGNDKVFVEDIIVTIMQVPDSTIVAYCRPDESGTYRLMLATSAKELLVRFSGFNIKKEIKRIDAKSQTLDFYAIEESTLLHEVQIKAQKLWGSRDTLNYLVAAYTKDHDNSIADILKKLPGITIDNGKIKYQGLPISHLYVENMDLMQGSYGILTESLKAKDVATVQVLENHEHIKALKDQVPPDNAAINLKLKKEAKGIWTKSLTLGLGYGDKVLWSNDANLMFFGKKRQHFIYYGNDNTGNHPKGRVANNAAILTSVLEPGASPVGTSLFNNQHLVTINNLNKLNDSTTLHYNFSYNHDRRLRSAYQKQTYILPEADVRVLTEDISSVNTSNEALLQLVYEKNADKKYFRNDFYANGVWNSAKGSVLSNNEDIMQKAYNRHLGIENQTHYIRRTDNGNGIDVKSNNSYKSSPQRLSVSGDMAASQEVDVARFSSRNTFSMLKDLRRRHWSIVPTASINIDYVGLNSSLQAQVNDAATMDYLHFDANVGAVARYVNNDFRMTFRLPLSLSYTTVLSEMDALRLRLRPSVSILWKANDFWTLSGGGSYGVNQTPWNQLISAYIMANYRTINRYKPTISEAQTAGVNLKLNFKDIMNEIFAYVEGKASFSWSDVVYGSYIDQDAHTIIQAVDMPNNQKTFSCIGNVSKDIEWHNIQLVTNANYTHSVNTVLRQSVVSNLKSNSFTAQLKCSGDVVSRLRLSYNLNWNSLNSRSEDYTQTIHTLEQSANMYLSIIPKHFFISLTANHSYNKSNPDKKNYVFLNSSLTLKTKKKHDFILEVNNITNTRTYLSQSNTDLVEYVNLYNIRPISVLLTARLNIENRKK